MALPAHGGGGAHESPLCLKQGKTCITLTDPHEWYCEPKKKRKEEVTPLAKYRHDCEPVSLMLITVAWDAT